MTQVTFQRKYIQGKAQKNGRSEEERKRDGTKLSAATEKDDTHQTENKTATPRENKTEKKGQGETQ